MSIDNFIKITEFLVTSFNFFHFLPLNNYNRRDMMKINNIIYIYIYYNNIFLLQ